MAAAIEIPSDSRDFLGRWNLRTQGDEYVRTARQVVTDIQVRVSNAIRARDPRLDESDLSTKVGEIILDKGYPVEQVTAFAACLAQGAPMAPAAILPPFEAVDLASGTAEAQADRRRCAQVRAGKGPSAGRNWLSNTNIHNIEHVLHVFEKCHK